MRAWSHKSNVGLEEVLVWSHKSNVGFEEVQAWDHGLDVGITGGAGLEKKDPDIYHTRIPKPGNEHTNKYETCHCSLSAVSNTIFANGIFWT